MEDFFDEEFYSIQGQIKKFDPELVIIEQRSNKSHKYLVNDMIKQLKLYGSRIINNINKF